MAKKISSRHKKLVSRVEATGVMNDFFGGGEKMSVTRRKDIEAKVKKIVAQRFKLKIN